MIMSSLQLNFMFIREDSRDKGRIIRWVKGLIKTCSALFTTFIKILLKPEVNLLENEE